LRKINDGENGFIVNMDGNEISLKIEELKNNKELYQIIKSNLESAPNENVDKGKEFIETIKHIGG
jgi:glycosyltransferase involved in cell wall biosynthesis